MSTPIGPGKRVGLDCDELQVTEENGHGKRTAAQRPNGGRRSKIYSSLDRLLLDKQIQIMQSGDNF